MSPARSELAGRLRALTAACRLYLGAEDGLVRVCPLPPAGLIEPLRAHRDTIRRLLADPAVCCRCIAAHASGELVVPYWADPACERYCRACCALLAAHLDRTDAWPPVSHLDIGADT